jgi:hypothetical protein
MARGAVAAQDSSHVFSMVILVGLVVLIRVRRLSLGKKPGLVFSFSFFINYAVMSPIC